MAEARSEEEEENLRRDRREPVVRRQPPSSGGRPDRRKPEHRLSQGPLSSIRAVIKRTSRSTTVSEAPRDRERERDRRRPEITILAAEPLPSTSWFPGAAAGIPPPPPPPAQIWGATIAPTIQPPPSYEEVIREKTQEQVLLPPAPSSPPVYRTTIATQTDPGPAPGPEENRERRQARPPRPPPPCTPRSTSVDDFSVASGQSAVGSSETNSVATNTPPELVACSSADAECSAVLTEQRLPSACGAQTDQRLQSSPPGDAAPPHVQPEPPRPRPRTRLGGRPVSSEVKVQTLVKLRDDGCATLAARGDGAKPEESQGRYLQELLEAFSSDDWGFPEHHDDGGGSRSESEEEDGEDMATLRARIQAFEQQQQVAAGSRGDAADINAGSVEGFVVAKRPEPRPRPRLQGQPAKSVPPVIAPKPKSFSPPPKPSSRGFWEDGAAAAETSEAAPQAPPPAEPTKSDPGSELKPPQTGEKPSVSPKPQSVTEPGPVPAPRPPPPKLTHSVSAGSSPPNPRPPRRPPVAPRASLGAPPQQERSSAEAGGEAAQDSVAQPAKGGSVRPVVKPAAPTSPRRASAPNLAPRPIVVPPARPDSNPVPPKAPGVNPAAAPRPPGPPKPPNPAPATAPAPATRKGSNPANPASSDPSVPQRPPSVKLLPLRPPPIKLAPGRPPPPALSSTASTNQVAASRAAPAGQTSSAPSTANQTQTQKAAKKGPPLPPRPKPGHPLYSSYPKQEVLIVLDDPNPAPTEPQRSSEGKEESSVEPLICPSQCLLDLDPQPQPVQDKDSESKTALEDLNQLDVQSILSVQPAELKEQPDPPAVSGPRCVALFDYEGEDDEELTFSQGDVIALLELVGEEWGRGRIHGRTGLFPLNFAEVLEPLPEPQPEPSSGETSKHESAETGEMEKSVTVKPSQSEAEEWAVALFDFLGQTADDLSFHKGALIQVTEHVDAEWRRGRLAGREGLYPAAFTQPCQAQPITGQQSAAKGTAKALFDFTAENPDELTLKVGDILTQVESVDEQWIVGVAGGKRGIVPKNYISFL
ncbi:uncharacterized protein V3H82_013765 [Fundulus diaphanus]